MKNKHLALIVVLFVLLVSTAGCGVLQAQSTYTPRPTYTRNPTYTSTETPFPTLEIPTNSSLPKPPSGNPVIDVTFGVINLPENGVDYSGGKNIYYWALATYLARFQAWQMGNGSYMVYVYENGTFVSFAGKSPASTGTVGAGVTGKFYEEFAYPLTGSLLPSPTQPLGGYLGSFDAKGDQQGHAQYQPGIATYFQPGFKAGKFLGFSKTFSSCGNGKFSWTMDGVTGDITGTVAQCSLMT